MRPVPESEIQGPGSNGKSPVIPRSSHLIVTTPNYVYSWNNEGLREIFRSESGGIIAAKEANNGSATLAVADSQVVILHDVKRGMEKSYKLKGTEASIARYGSNESLLIFRQGRVHLLQYANQSNSLFFTTSLQNAVQSYSLTDSRLLDPAHAHPTPPTVFAVSPSSHLLLSASDSPPTTYLHDLRLRRSPLLLQPSASDAAVVVAAFHPEQHDIFLLGFADGTLAAYNARFLVGAQKERMKKHTYSGSGGEIGHFKKLHVTTSKGATDPDGVYDAAVYGGYDDGTATTSAGSRSIGITGAAFVPGYHCRAVTVGGDGRCRIVDFADGGRILRTWHLQAAATCLSILSERETGAPLEAEQPARRRSSMSPRKKSMSTQHTTKIMIAVGRDDGTVHLYDGLGLQLFEKRIDPAGGRIIDVAWVDGPGYGMQPETLERVKAETQVPRPPPKESRSEDARGSKRGRIASLLGTHRKIKEEVIIAEDAAAGVAIQRLEHIEEPNGLHVDDRTVRRRSIHPSGQPALPPAPMAEHTDLFSPTKQPRLPRRQSTHRPRVSSITFEDASTAPAGSPLRPKEGRGALTERPMIETGSLHHNQSKRLPGGRRRDTSFVDYRRMPGAYISSTTSLATNTSGECGMSLRDSQNSSSKGADQHIHALPSFAMGIPTTATQERREEPSAVGQSPPRTGRLSASQADVDAWLSDNEAHHIKSNANPAKPTSRSQQPLEANSKVDQRAGTEPPLAHAQEKPLPPPPIVSLPPTSPPLPPPPPPTIPARSAERPTKFKLRTPSLSPRKIDRALTEISHNSRRPPQTDKRLSLPLALPSAKAEEGRGDAYIGVCRCGELGVEIRLLKEQMHADSLAVREEMAEGFRRVRGEIERVVEVARRGEGSWDS